MKSVNNSLIVRLSNGLVEKLIRRVIRQEKRRTSNTKNISLTALWHHLCANPLLKLVAPHTRHPFNLSGHDYVMFHCVKMLGKENIHVSPDFYWKNPQALQQVINHPQSALIVTLHNGFAFTMKEILKAGRQVVTIVKNKELAQKNVFSHSALDVTPTLVTRDKYCLAHLRKAVSTHHILCCAVDFKNPATGRFNLISPALFEFSSQLDLPLYYSRVAITPEGKAACELIGPLYGNATEKLESFMHYARLSRPHAKYEAAPYA